MLYHCGPIPSQILINTGLSNRLSLDNTKSLPLLTINQILWHLSHHYNDVIMGAVASQINSLTMFTQSFIQTQIKENIKGPRHWPLCGEFTGDRWIPRTNGQLHWKCFHLMMSSWLWKLTQLKSQTHLPKDNDKLRHVQSGLVLSMQFLVDALR